MLMQAYLRRDMTQLSRQLGLLFHVDLGSVGLSFAQARRLAQILRGNVTEGEEVAIYLKVLPDDKTTEFTNVINRYLDKRETINEAVFNSYLDDPKQEPLIRFKAFYTMFTFFHDKGDGQRCASLVNRASTLSGFPLWSYAKSTVLAAQHNEEGMRQALHYAEACIKRYAQPPYNAEYPGIYHNYAELVYYALDRGFDIDMRTYNRALDYINRAIGINDRFAKYYYTKGRLVSRCPAGHDYPTAIDLIQHALDVEDSSRSGYAIFKSEYEIALLRCRNEQELQEQSELIETELKGSIEEINHAVDNATALGNDLKADIDEQKKSQLELLGFFSGVISLIIVSSQVALGLTYPDSVILLVAFTGCLVVAFAALHIVIQGPRSYDGDWNVGAVRQSLLMTVIGCGMLLLAVFLHASGILA